MSRRPLCIIGCLVILILWSLNLMGVSTFGGTSLDLTDSDRSVIIQGILYKQESNSFYIFKKNKSDSKFKKTIH